MRISHSLGIIGLVILAIAGSSVYALPSAPPPGGYTGGIFSYYFKNIIAGDGTIGTTTAGVCPTGKVITGFSTGSSTYGLPICSTITSPQYWTSTDAGANIYFTGAGNVGIGIVGATRKLEVSGDAVINGVTVGRGAGNIATNTANGFGALQGNTTGFWNTANGYMALSSNTTGLGNTAYGYRALAVNSTGVTNTANGYSALQTNTIGIQNTANGANALNDNTIGNNNTADGQSALQYNITGNNNTANGVMSLYANNIGNNNIAMGYWAGFSNTTGNYNTNNGGFSLYQNNGGSSNTALGYFAGQNLLSGDNNIAIGANTNFVSTTASNQLSIGNWIYGSGGNIGIGTGTALTAKLTVAGTIQITGGTPGVGKVLTSDAAGLASWITPSASTVTATGITGGTQNYITKFGTGGTGLYISQVFDTGTGVGIGTTTPGAKLEVAGTVKITGGTPGAGKVLTSDATGLASWTTPSVAITGGQTNYGARWLTATTLGTGSIYDTGTGVGIGTTTPTSALQVVGSSFLGGGSFELRDAGISDSTAVRLFSAGGNLYLQNGAGDNIVFRGKTGAATMNLSNAGVLNVVGGITDSAGTRMDAAGGWLRTYGSSGWYNGTYAGGMYMIDSSWIRTYNGKYFYVDSIIQAGAYMNSPAYYYISDARLKKDLRKIDSPLAKIEQMNGYYFNWKKDNKKDLGLIAQEVEKIFPDAVGEYTDPDSKEKYKNVEYGHLVAPVIEAIKELAGNVKNNTSEISALKSENAALKKRLDAIEARLAQ